MKRFIIQVIIFTVTVNLFSFDGRLIADPIAGKTGVDIYAGGFCETMHTPSPGYWKNGKWVELSVPDFAYTAVATSVAVSGADIYITGYCLTVRRKGLREIPGYWKNGAWTDVSVPEQAMGSVILSLALSGNDIIIRGYCKVRSGSTMMNVPGYWKNGIWNAFAVPEGSTRVEITSLNVSGNDVYAGGWCEYRSGDGKGALNSVPGCWKNGVWKQLPVPSNCNISEVTSLFISGRDVYAGGRCLKTGTGGSGKPVYMPGYWKNDAWVQLAGFDPLRESYVTSVAVSGNDVYAGGYNENMKGVCSPGYWKNGTWYSLNETGSRLHFSAYSKSVYLYTPGNDIYAVEYAVINSDIKDPGYWKNGDWISLPLYDTYDSAFASSLVVSGGDVYVSGNCYSSPGRTMGYWKNGKWTALTLLDTSENTGDPLVSSVAVSGNDVYVGGCRNIKPNMVTAGYWKNGNWNALDPSGGAKDSAVTSFVISGSDIYAGGYCYNSGNYPVAGYWKNGTWKALTPSDSVESSYVTSLALSGSSVYAGGYTIKPSDDGAPAGERIPWYFINGKRVDPENRSYRSQIDSLAVSGNVVYAGGWGSNDSGNGYWKNGKWVRLNSPEPGQASYVTSVAVSGKDVYAGGYSMDGPVLIPVYWKNGKCIVLPSPDSAGDSEVLSLAVSGSDVYAAGYITKKSGIKTAGYWKNGKWKELSPVNTKNWSYATSIVIVSVPALKNK